jgi:hypothetical protein
MRLQQLSAKEKDPPSRRVFIPKKLYLMKKIITFKLSVQKYCQMNSQHQRFSLKKVKSAYWVIDNSV